MNAHMGPELHLLYEFGDFRLDSGRRLLYAKGQSTSLAIKPKVFDALLYFVEHPGEVLDKDRLLSELWPGVVVEENGLTQVVSALRRVLKEAPGENRYLATAPGRGYRFVADVVRVPDRAPGEEEPKATGGPTTPRAAGSPGPTRIAVQLALAAVLGIALLAYGGFARWRAAHEIAAPAAGSPATSGLPASTVAVLPFKNLSPDADNAYVAFGVAESVLHRLAGIRGLTLIARTSSFALGEHPADVRDVGRALNARYLVEGSVQRSGERLRVTAQLIDASTGGHLWSLRFDRDLDDIFAVEDEIARNIATALEVTLDTAKHPYASFGTDAYLAYLEGRALLATNRVEDAERATRHFSRAIEIAPEFAAAYAALADAHWRTEMLAQTGGTGFAFWIRTDRQRERVAEAARNAQPLLDQALHLDDTLAEAHILRADLKAFAGDRAGAEAEYRHGLELNPDYGAGHERYASLLWQISVREDDALAEIDAAIRVDPLSPRNYYLRGVMHHFNESGGAFTEAEANFAKALALAPDYHPALLRLGVIRWYEGHYAEAVRLGERALAIDPRAEWIRWPLVQFYLEVDEVDAARSVLLDAPETVLPISWLTVCLYEQQPQRAADLLRAEPTTRGFIDDDVRGYVIRDAAQASGHLAQARQELLAQLGHRDSHDEPFKRIALAQLTFATGDRSEAEAIARELLNDNFEIVGFRTVFPRAAALTLLAQNDTALDLLRESYTRGFRKRWWYALRRDPAFDALRSDLRFQSLAATADAHAAAERESLKQMRERGEVPKRSVNPGSSADPCRPARERG